MKNLNYFKKTMDILVKEGDYWVVYRHSETWGDCPIFKSKSKEQAERLLK